MVAIALLQLHFINGCIINERSSLPITLSYPCKQVGVAE
jgi:hypothetical protein